MKNDDHGDGEQPEDGDSEQPEGGTRPPSDPKEIADRALKDLEAIQRNMRPALDMEKQLKPIRAALDMEKQLKPIRAALDMEKQLKPIRAALDMEKQLKPIRAALDMEKQLKPIRAALDMEKRLKPIRAALDMEERLKPLLDIQSRMKALGEVAGEDSTIGRLSKQVAEHATAAFELGAADVLRATTGTTESIGFEPRELPKIPPDAAQLMAGLLATGAEHLQEFKTSAAEESRTARLAIRLSILAVVVTVALTLLQIGYSEYRREPSKGAEVEATLEAMRTELAAAREAAAAASERLGVQMASSDKESAAVLREIRDLLSRPATSPAPGPEAP